MEAVLVRATMATAGGYVQGMNLRAILAERTLSKLAPQGSKRQSGIAAPHLASILQSEMLPGPLRILWNGGNDHVASRDSEETTSSFPDDEGQIQEGFLNYDTLGQSVVDDYNEEELRCEDSSRAAHTRESFSKFLRPLVSANELKDIAQACYLSNLAYIISEIKGDELERDHGLRLVTSSIQQENATVTAQFNKTLRAPATAYALAATASYLQSQNTSSEWNNANPKGEESAVSRAVDHEMASAMSTFMNSPVQINSSATAGTVDMRGYESASTSNNSTTCGWFVCDDQTTAIRFFSIQGSESMASWKANLRFQPTQFENATSGVMVHQGVYEVAKSLYDQMLPLVQSHMAAYGKRARISFTGHSLGGSLAVLLSLMFRCRGLVPVSAVCQVYTFGAPSVLNGGNEFLKRLGFSHRHVQSVVIARDLVPRIFASDIPQQIVKILRRVNQKFREIPNFVHQRQLYTTTGQLVILQPEAQQAPGHPLLPSGSGLYRLDQPAQIETWPNRNVSAENDHSDTDTDLRAAESCFLNSPHPLDIMSDPSAYGAEGAISRDHDPRSYRRAVNHVLQQTVRWLQRRKRIEVNWHQLSHDKMGDPFPGAINWPQSPAGSTPIQRSKQLADSCAMFFHHPNNNNHGFSRASSITGACNNLNLGLRKTIHTRGTHPDRSRSRYGSSVISLKH